MRGDIFVLTIPDLTGAGKDAEHEYAPHQVECILLYGQAGSISADAIELALRHQVDILLCDGLGNITGRFQPEEPAAPVLIQAAQFRLIGTPRSMEMVKEWIGLKLRRKMAVLGRLQRYRDGEKALLLKTTRQKLADYTAQLHKVPTSPVPEAANAIRIIEAHASKAYFKTLSDLLPTEYQFDGRSRQPAQDIFNAFLNYGYGILYRQVDKALAKAGLSAYGGFLHTMERNQKAFLFDIVEPYRAWVDHLVFVLCSRKHATLRHIRAHMGGLWLTQTGKALMLETFFEVFDRKLQPEEEEQNLTLAQMLRQEVRSIASTIRQEWRLPLEPALALVAI